VKKKVVAFLLICAVALSFAPPAIATTMPVVSIEQEIEVAPFFEMTRNYLRTYHGVLQFRVWGMTSGRWLTDWADI